MPVVHAGGSMNIIKKIANSDNSHVGFMVMRPDPNSKVFKEIEKQGLHYIPVIDFALEDKYDFYDLKVAHTGLFGMGKGKNIQTACTSVALVTGNPERAQGRDKKRAEVTIKRVKSTDATKFTPTTSDFRDTFNSMRKIATSEAKALLEKLKATAADLAEKAKQKASEM